MLELPLFVALAGSVCFLTYEFYRINRVYEERLHYYRFLPGFGMGNFSKKLDAHTINFGSGMGTGEIDSKISRIEARMERQEAVIEKLIRGLGE